MKFLPGHFTGKNCKVPTKCPCNMLLLVNDFSAQLDSLPTEMILSLSL